jgi:pimeloyl-ACP methyl ester carboxylesterase
MATYALIHGAGDGGWFWHLVAAELRGRGQEVVAPDLPTEDDAAGLPEYAEAVVEAVGDRGDLIVVAQSFGGFTAPLVCDLVPADLLVLLAGMVPSPAWPEVPTRFLLCRDDRFFPPEFLRRVVRERLGIVPDEIDGSHCVALSRPRELADRLEGYRAAL